MFEYRMSDFILVFRQWVGRLAGILLCDANRSELTARMSGCETGSGAEVSCNVNRMRKAFYFFSTAYDAAVSSHFPKLCTH